ncbi:MAG TPA: N-methyl-L-tryptophan oxidase [Isosphaeraceae bacterium]|jgi:sarcosine oxidase|nr:N-methyl-L-tryptophan oxidase [Isosphaeraceae bacterium]
MIEEHRWKNVVLGAGAMGTAAAYHLAKRGEPVLLVEQFALGHDRGSSHGAARITRHSYADPHYARLMPAAFRAWRELEADAGQNLYVRTGGVSFGPPESDYVARVAANLADLGVPHRLMKGWEFSRSIPAFTLPDSYDVVFEPDAGLLAAARIVRLQAELARWIGNDKTTIYENFPIRRIDLDAGRPTLVGDTLRIVADRLIVTAGAWVGRLFPELATTLRPTRQQVLYFRPEDPSAFAIGRFPVFIHKGIGPLEAFYGMPDHLGGGVKAARHGGPEVDPDGDDRAIGDEYRDLVRDFLRRHIPALAEAPIINTEVCLYTEAADEHFRLGFWKGRADVVVASPCSGHGFKFSNLIGRVLADLATLGATDIPLDLWRPEPA